MSAITISLGIFFALHFETSLPLTQGYKQQSFIPSIYAVQAAAADEQFAYAISNSKVAQYDRKTGELKKLSTGDAEHLNSGWIWKGKIYCAHSNFPKLPEKSDLRVYDPDTGKLTIHHSFTKSLGSLTWAIRDPENKFWWCCFAYYQKDNSKTYLAKMDDEFKEVQRWSFPEKVVKDWDNASASGGIWDGNTLLVTHHHFKVLYRLKVPKEGDILEFVAALSCPFPGQGIAYDPVTLGLVGIHRPDKKILFAIKEK
ncbi:MAG: endonuclease [Gemmataceae bacterium]|nr:endonuclease [Gemmataceae bacterium]